MATGAQRMEKSKDRPHPGDPSDAKSMPATSELHQSYIMTSTTVWNKFFGWELITVIHISGVSWIWSAWGQHSEGGLATICQGSCLHWTCTCNMSNVLWSCFWKPQGNWASHLSKLRSDLIWFDNIWSRKQYPSCPRHLGIQGRRHRGVLWTEHPHEVIKAHHSITIVIHPWQNMQNPMCGEDIWPVTFFIDFKIMFEMCSRHQHKS